MTIHTVLVAEQSPALKTLVSGFMEEAQTGTATWEEMDEDTFARWAQFVYTGDYSPASHSMVAEPETVASNISVPPEPEREENIDFDWATSAPKKKKDLKRGAQVTGCPAFHDLVYPIPSPEFVDMCKPRPNGSSAEDYTPVFLGHARLYAFAEKWDIRPLKALVLHKLHTILRMYKPYEARYGDVVELIRYTYEHTPCRERVDGLRELVTRFVAQEQIQIARSRPCLELVEVCGPFARDLLSSVMERVKYSKYESL